MVDARQLLADEERQVDEEPQVEEGPSPNPLTPKYCICTFRAWSSLMLLFFALRLCTGLTMYTPMDRIQGLAWTILYFWIFVFTFAIPRCETSNSQRELQRELLQRPEGHGWGRALIAHLVGKLMLLTRGAPFCLVAPLMHAVNLVFWSDVPFSQNWHHLPRWWLFGAKFSNWFGLILFLCLTLKNLFGTLSVIWDAIASWAAKLDQDDEIQDWSGIQAQMLQTAKLTEGSFDLPEAGLLWSLVVLASASYSLFCALFPISSHSFDDLIVGDMLVLFFSFLTCSLLFLLSNITSLWQSKNLSSGSVLAAARRADVSTMNEAQRQGHERLVNYLMNSDLGGKLFGVLITRSTLVSEGARVLVFIPAIVQGARLFQTRL